MRNNIMLRIPCPVQRGFTLTELLVVVAIIVVLLALLIPAMEKARYQAMLAVCAAHQHTAGVGATTYAAQHKRQYPRKPPWKGLDAQPFYLRDDPAYDLRKIIKDYIPLGALVEPLAGKVDLSTEKSDTVMMAYGFWFGVAYPGEQRGMFRLGDKVTWTQGGYPAQDRWPGQPAEIELDVLMGDIDIIGQRDNLGHTAHPDGGNVRQLATYQDESATPLAGSSAVISTLSWWTYGGTHKRGRSDLQFLRADNSVQRLGGVEWDDPRLVRLPDYIHQPSAVTGNLRWASMPRQ